MATVKKQKPKKPYPTYPLTAHPNGQWCKKIRGKLYFFGVWADPQAALDGYLVVKDDLHAGRTPRPRTLSDSGLTIKDACNAFLSWQNDKLETGEIGARWFEDCRSIIADFARSIGRERPADDLQPLDFQHFRAKLSKRLGVHALRRHIIAIKSVFRYAYDMDLIEHPVKFGREFEIPTTTQQRKAKQQAEVENGKKLFTREELREIIEQADQVVLKATIFLGINGGFGNTDCASLPRSSVDLTNAIIVNARPKTGVERVVPLWPETIRALAEVMDQRPKPESDQVAKLVFLTPRGKQLVRQRFCTHDDGTLKVTNIDQLSSQFSVLLSSLGYKRRGVGFYTLRHTFRTWADTVHDQHAIHKIMGHAIPGMSGIYVEEISTDRLRVVTEHVRQVLWPSASR